jgi:glucose/arabinose dehydrogenase
VTTRLTALVAAGLLGACATSPGASPTATLPSASATQAPSPTTRPAITLPPAPSIHAAAGFTPYIYASGLALPTAMAFGPDGGLYITGAGGAIWVVPQPGAAAVRLVAGLPTALGLVWRDQDLFASVRGSIRAYHLQNGALTGGSVVVSGLPTGRHQNDSLVRLRNGDFLLGIGSTCDVCNEGDPRSATVVRFHADWSYAGVVVRGARNPFGLALRPTTATAYVTINGQDNLGSQPADHLLQVVDGENAGWPSCWPSFPDGGLHGSCAGVAPPVAVFEPHSSADGIVFYDGGLFPAEYQDNAFVTEWGDNAGTSLFRRVKRVVFRGTPGKDQGQVSDFATGFVHPLAIAVAQNGGLLVGDYGNGTIVEIAPTP